MLNDFDERLGINCISLIKNCIATVASLITVGDIVSIVCNKVVLIEIICTFVQNSIIFYDTKHGTEQFYIVNAPNILQIVEKMAWEQLALLFWKHKNLKAIL